MAVTIERMRFVHVDQVAVIEEAVYSTPWSKSAFVTEILDNGFASYYVALADGRVVGYAGIWTILDEAHVTTLAVCPLWQKKGVGKLLLEHLITQAVEKGAVRMTLEVRVSNYSAQDLYKKFGFTACGIRPNYYSDEDAIIMWREDLAALINENAAGEEQ